MNTPSAIPERYVEFCKAVARLAQEADLDRLTLEFKPGFDDEAWRDPIRAVWTQGRHGEDARSLTVSCEVIIRTQVQP